MSINLQSVFAGRERTRRPSGPTGGRPRLGESLAAPTRRRDPDTLVPGANAGKRERVCAGAGNGDEQTWPTSMRQLREAKQAMSPAGTHLDVPSLVEPEAGSRQNRLDR